MPRRFGLLVGTDEDDLVGPKIFFNWSIKYKISEFILYPCGEMTNLFTASISLIMAEQSEAKARSEASRQNISNFDI